MQRLRVSLLTRLSRTNTPPLHPLVYKAHSAVELLLTPAAVYHRQGTVKPRGPSGKLYHSRARTKSATLNATMSSETKETNPVQTPHPALRRYQDPALVDLLDVLEKARATKADPQVLEGIERVLRHVDLREDYALRMSSQESAICRQVVEDTLETDWKSLEKQGKTTMNLTPKMLSGRLEGQFLKSLVSGQRARRVLDVGMYTGYSALSMAEALPADGELVTLDREPYLQERNRAVFDSVPHGKKITIKIGNAMDSLRELLKEGKQFDFIFLDAKKDEYLDYLKLCMEEGLLAENGTIAVDNAFMHGMNYLPSDKPPNASRLFGEHVTKDKTLHKVLVPVRDGVILIRRLSEVERDLKL